MKIKLFLTSSLSLLGLWLAAAYVHTVDLTSYHQASAEQTAAISESSIETPVAQAEEEIQTSVATK